MNVLGLQGASNAISLLHTIGKENRLRCHFCGYNIQPISQCPACGNTAMKMVGYGTERVESELTELFQDARIQRLDYETTRTKTAFENIITGFEKKEIDILIGTQMLTKGLDFEALSLVGILDADHALNFPDFRAFERSFQLFTQVGGRAGRRNKQGKVIIQANQPEHFVIQQVTESDYPAFYEKEVGEREKFHYPPFGRLIKITVKHKDYLHTEKAADMLAFLLRPQLGSMMLGPGRTVCNQNSRTVYQANLNKDCSSHAVKRSEEPPSRKTVDF